MNKVIKDYLSKLGKKGGQSTSAAKALAARQNGKKGGRPSKKAAKRGTMKKLLSIAITVLALAACTFAKEVKTRPVTAELVQRATAAVPALRSMMRDPDSFVLEQVLQNTVVNQKYPDRINAVCYVFRAHNAMGGYGDSATAELSWSGQLFIIGGYSGMDCLNPTANHGYVDITAEVKAELAQSAPVVSPADAASKAQQYADCLKAAVKNPSIVCKQ
jgi:hypothetical protein